MDRARGGRVDPIRPDVGGLFLVGLVFLGRFVESWREFDFNMFTLTVLGTGTAYVFSTVALLFPDVVPQSMHGGPELYF